MTFPLLSGHHVASIRTQESWGSPCQLQSQQLMIGKNVRNSKTRNFTTREYKENTADTEWQTNDNEDQMVTDMAGTAKTTKANTKYMTLSMSKVHMAVLPAKHLSTVRLRAEHEGALQPRQANTILTITRHFLTTASNLPQQHDKTLSFLVVK